MTQAGKVVRVFLILLLLIAVPIIPGSSARPSPGSVSLLRSGSLMIDSLTGGNVSPWVFAGTAVHEHAPYSYSEDAQGLHISVQAVSSNQWAGYFAKSPNTHARVFHAVVSLLYSTIPSGHFNTGLYVQTANRVSYIACVGHVTPKGYYWLVNYAQGSQATVVKFHRLYTQMGGPMVRDCTIATDGENFLSVYLDGKKVYSNQSMGLQMPLPLNAYLEVESTCTSKMLTGTYTDFYEVANDSIAVRGVPPGDYATILSPEGGMITTGVAGPDGRISFDISSQRLPILGVVKVTGEDLGATPSTGVVKIWGGDLYQLELLPYR